MNTIDFFEEIKQKLKHNFPMVIYRKPNEEEVFGCIQNSEELFEMSSYNQQGFVFCPFEKSDKSIIFPIENCKQISTKVELSSIEKINSSYKIISSSKNQYDYEKLISNTVEHINETNVEKIVISRKELLHINSFNVIAIYKNMLKNYKSAFVYCWFHPKIGMWMGASPERLLQIDNGIFKTMALASTKSYEGSLDVNWEEKELEEQQIVTDYILNNLKPVLSNIKTKGPYTVKAGSLLHLRTDISSEIIQTNTVKKLVEELHPTPAVCGMPKNDAKYFILKNEGYNRSYYTGFLGELNMNKSTNLFVNLRCMEVKNLQISLYIGGGITAKSNPTKEWDETISKSNIMKQVL